MEDGTYFFITHKHNNEFKVLNSKKPEDSSTELSEKDKNNKEKAIVKYFFEKLYTLKEMKIEYEYHKLGG